MRDEVNMIRKHFERFCGCLHSNKRDAVEAPPSVQAILQTLSKYVISLLFIIMTFFISLIKLSEIILTNCAF